MVTCPNCGHANAKAARICASCSSELRPVAAPKSRPRVSLRVVRADGGAEASAVMNGETLTCGQKGDLALPDDPFLAGIQVRFSFSGGALQAEDVGGGNGTFVRLRGETQLPAGSELRVGRQRLRLEALAPPVPGPEGTLEWGAADGGALFRLVQLYEGGIQGGAIMLKPGTYALGREVGDFAFPGDGFISGKHASLTVRDGKAFIRDVGSSNGTFVRLHAPTAVENGDQFLVGRELLRVEVAPK